MLIIRFSSKSLSSFQYYPYNIAPGYCRERSGKYFIIFDEKVVKRDRLLSMDRVIEKDIRLDMILSAQER